MEHLIDVDGPLSRGPGIVRTAVASIAALLIFGTGAMEALDPPPLPRLKGNEAVVLRKQIHEAKFWDGTQARWYERNFKLRGNVRRRIAPYWAYAMYRLGDVPVDKVIAGKEGWLFMRDRVMLSSDSLPQSLAISAHHFAAVGRQLAAVGSTLVTIPLPRKAVACQSMLRYEGGAALGFDEELIEAFKDTGVLTVDVLDAWLAMPPSDVYKIHDTHWAPPARLEVVRALKGLVPAFQEPDFQAWIVPGPERKSASLLFQIGLSSRSRLYQGIDSGIEKESLMRPARVVRRIDSGELPIRALLVGSSFSAGFRFSELLMGLLRVGIEDASEEGMPPFVSLEKALVDRSPGEIPPYVLAEFPVHQAASFTPVWNPSVNSVAGIYVALGQHGHYERLHAIPPQSNDEVVRRGVAKIRFGGGTLISSGDGVLSLRIESEGELPSRWQLRTSGAHLVFTMPAGVSQVTLPLIEGAFPTGEATLWPLDAAAEGAILRATAVVDVDLSGGTSLEVAGLGAGVWSFACELAIQPLDVLALEWKKHDQAPMAVTARGVTAEGTEIERTWRARTRATVGDARGTAVFSLGAFQGGRLTEVSVTGGLSEVQAVIGHKLR